VGGGAMIDRPFGTNLGSVTTELLSDDHFCRTYCLTAGSHLAAGSCLTRKYTLDPDEVNPWMVYKSSLSVGSGYV
jgi:hypothetical protein